MLSFAHLQMCLLILHPNIAYIMLGVRPLSTHYSHNLATYVYVVNVVFHLHSSVGSHPHGGMAGGGSITEGILHFSRSGLATGSGETYRE